MIADDVVLLQRHVFFIFMITVIVRTVKQQMFFLIPMQCGSENHGRFSFLMFPCDCFYIIIGIRNES